MISAFDPDSTARRVTVALAKLSLALRSQAWREGETSGLTPTQGQILERLHAGGQPARLAALAEALGITPQTASAAVTALVAKRLVAKARAHDDARALSLRLTARGAAAAERAAHWPDFLMRAADGLDAVERAGFLKTLLKLIRTLQERGEIPVARMCVTCSYFRPNAHADRVRPHHCALVDAAFGDAALRVDCADHAVASPGQAAALWAAFNPSPVHNQPPEI